MISQEYLKYNDSKKSSKKNSITTIKRVNKNNNDPDIKNRHKNLKHFIVYKIFLQERFTKWEEKNFE